MTFLIFLHVYLFCRQRLKNSVNQWKKYVAKRKEQRDAEQAFLRNFPVVAVPRLTIQRGCSIEYPDCTSLNSERKYFLIKKKRSMRIAKKALIYWQSWASNQRIKRNFFNVKIFYYETFNHIKCNEILEYKI